MESIVSYPNRGIGGKSNYRGNCSPKLIEDLIDFYQCKQISDYMVGSGTTRDVAKEKKIICCDYDLHSGFNLLTDDIQERNEFVFWHPPYHDMIQYADNMYSAQDVIKKYGYNPNEYDLSQCKDWKHFVDKMNYCMMKQFTSLEKGGRMAVLMGDLKRKGKLYSMLLDIIKPGVIENIVIKAQHNCVSDRTVYNNKFIKIVHEYVLIVKKQGGLIYPMKYSIDTENDIRDMKASTWKDVVADVLETLGTKASLNQIYQKIEGHKKTDTNQYWKEKIRQTLQLNNHIFQSYGKGYWGLVA